jgi:hypothetical protein
MAVVAAAAAASLLALEGRRRAPRLLLFHTGAAVSADAEAERGVGPSSSSSTAASITQAAALSWRQPPSPQQTRSFGSSSSGDDGKDGRPKWPRRRFEAVAADEGPSLKAFIRRAQVLALYRSFLRVRAWVCCGLGRFDRSIG